MMKKTQLMILALFLLMSACLASEEEQGEFADFVDGKCPDGYSTAMASEYLEAENCVTAPVPVACRTSDLPSTNTLACAQKKSDNKIYQFSASSSVDEAHWDSCPSNASNAIFAPPCMK